MWATVSSVVRVSPMVLVLSGVGVSSGVELGSWGTSWAPRTAVTSAPTYAGMGTRETSRTCTLVWVMCTLPSSSTRSRHSTGRKPTDSLFSTPSRARVRASRPAVVSLMGARTAQPSASLRCSATRPMASRWA